MLSHTYNTYCCLDYLLLFNSEYSFHLQPLLSFSTPWKQETWGFYFEEYRKGTLAQSTLMRILLTSAIG